jgi:hypothetical protein
LRARMTAAMRRRARRVVINEHCRAASGPTAPSPRQGECGVAILVATNLRRSVERGAHVIEAYGAVSVDMTIHASPAVVSESRRKRKIAPSFRFSASLRRAGNGCTGSAPTPRGIGTDKLHRLSRDEPSLHHTSPSSVSVSSPRNALLFGAR